MGYNRSGGGTVTFKPDADLDGAVLAEIKAKLFTDAALLANARGGSFPREGRDVEAVAWYSWTDTRLCRAAETLADLVAQFLPSASFEDFELTFYEDDKIGQEDVLFDALAPYILPGETVEWRGEDDTFWRWRFDGKRMHTEYGTITYGVAS